MTTKELIESQAYILREININDMFIQRVMFEVHKNAYYLENNSALKQLQYSLTKINIIDISKLLNPNEAYSLHKIFHLNPQKDKSLKEVNTEKLRELRNKVKELQKKFKKLDIDKIRNEYIAHLDNNGKTYSLTSHQLSLIISETKNIYNEIRLALLGSQFLFDRFDKSVARVVKVLNQYKAIYELTRKAFHDNEEYINRDTLWDIFKNV